MVDHQEDQSGRVRAARWIVRRWPLARGRGILTRLLLPANAVPPDGVVVETEFGCRIMLHPDELFLPIWLYGVYEPRLTRLYSHLIEPGMTVVDVGANIGWYTSLFAQWVGPAGAVHAFEPLARLAAFCGENVGLNEPLAHVVVNSVGLGSSAGEFVLYTFRGLSDAHASATTLDRPDATRNRCTITTLDQYLRDSHCRRVDFMKCDVEGHELEVFRGGDELLRREDAPLIAFEVNARCLSSRSLKATEIQDSLLERGYSHLVEVTPRGVRLVTEPLELRNADYIAAKRTGLERLRHFAGPGVA